MDELRCRNCGDDVTDYPEWTVRERECTIRNEGSPDQDYTDIDCQCSDCLLEFGPDEDCDVDAAPSAQGDGCGL